MIKRNGQIGGASAGICSALAMAGVGTLPDGFDDAARARLLMLASELHLRDDPLMRLDEFRLLSGPAETDVTEKYAA